jgi:hypothetical protein
MQTFDNWRRRGHNLRCRPGPGYHNRGDGDVARIRRGARSARTVRSSGATFSTRSLRSKSMSTSRSSCRTTRRSSRWSAGTPGGALCGCSISERMTWKASARILWGTSRGCSVDRGLRSWTFIRFTFFSMVRAWQRIGNSSSVTVHLRGLDAHDVMALRHNGAGPATMLQSAIAHLASMGASWRAADILA